jgi:hypothetical protein
MKKTIVKTKLFLMQVISIIPKATRHQMTYENSTFRLNGLFYLGDRHPTTVYDRLNQRKRINFAPSARVKHDKLFNPFNPAKIFH